MDVRAILMGLAFAVMWSSAFTSARIIVADAPPLTTLALRFALSGALALGIAAILGQRFRLTGAQWRATILFGICQNALYLGLNFVAMQWIEASLAAIIASTLPLIVALAGWTLFRERLPRLGVLGLFAGLAGVLLIMGSRLQAGVDLTGVVFCVIAAIALATATLAVKNASAGGNLLVVIGYQMLVGAVVLAGIGLATEPLVVRPSWTLLAAFVYTTLVPGLAATWVWFLLVARIGATRAATFHFLNPFFGVAIAALLLGEALGWRDVLGVAVITAGILAVQVSRVQARAVSTPDSSVK